MFRELYELVPALNDVTVSVHCHDDLGLAVANSLAGLQAGCRQVECAINGIGERAGNASLEEIVMVLRTRGPYLGLTSGVDTTEIARTSRLVSRLTGYAVQPNKAVVGRNAFAHESGIHQDGVLKERRPTRSWTRPRWGLRRIRSCSASTRPPRAETGVGGTGIRGHGREPHGRVSPLQGDRGPQAACDRAGSRGADDRGAPRDCLRLSTRMVRRRGLLAAAAARDRRGPRARWGPPERIIHRRRAGTTRSFRAINAATAKDARLREFRVDAVTKVARMRSARPPLCSILAAPPESRSPARARACPPTSSRRPAGPMSAHSRTHCGGARSSRAMPVALPKQSRSGLIA